MQSAVPYTEQPDIGGVRLLLAKTLRRSTEFARDRPAPAIDVNGDVLTVVIGLDLSADIALVDRVAETRGLLSGPACLHRGLLGYTSRIARVRQPLHPRCEPGTTVHACVPDEPPKRYTSPPGRTACNNRLDESIV